MMLSPKILAGEYQEEFGLEMRQETRMSPVFDSNGERYIDGNTLKRAGFGAFGLSSTVIVFYPSNQLVSHFLR